MLNKNCIERINEWIEASGFEAIDNLESKVDEEITNLQETIINGYVIKDNSIILVEDYIRENLTGTFLNEDYLDVKFDEYIIEGEFTYNCNVVISKEVDYTTDEDLFQLGFDDYEVEDIKAGAKAIRVIAANYR